MKKKSFVLGFIALAVIALGGLLIGLYVFRSFDVVFDSKGGTSVAAEKVVNGQTVSEPQTPVLNGYIFDGWYLNGEEFDFNTKITEDITLTGKWNSIVLPVE